MINKNKIILYFMVITSILVVIFLIWLGDIVMFLCYWLLFSVVLGLLWNIERKFGHRRVEKVTKKILKKHEKDEKNNIGVGMNHNTG
jgi:ascorbate-specific PTS system EIIC-type component UlaA